MNHRQQVHVNRLERAVLFGFSGVSMTLAGAFPSAYSITAAVATTLLTVMVAYQRPSTIEELVEDLTTGGGSE